MRQNALRASVGCLILALGCVASVIATAGDGDQRGARAEVREQRQGGFGGQMPEPVRDNRQQQGEWRGGGDPRQSQSPQQAPQQQMDNGRRGRMSPEDRRALRRQIDQASHDLYEPRR